MNPHPFWDDAVNALTASALIGGAGGALVWLAFWPFTFLPWRRRP